MRYADLPCYWPPAPTTSTSTGGEGGVAGPEAVEEQFEALVEANDILLERVVCVCVCVCVCVVFKE